MNQIRILLAEDERRMGDALSQLLTMEGYDVDQVFDGETALSAIRTGIYDLVILDIMMPGVDGYSVARQVRKEGCQTLIIMLTAKSDLDDKVRGLDAGADDYLTKPFMTKELLARIRALTRRKRDYDYDPLSFGDITLNPGTADLVCTRNGQSVRLGEKEYRILEYMISNKGRILSREQLAVKIWGYDNKAEYNNVEVYMSFTRKKLAFVGAETRIKAVRGIGYELRCPDVS